MGFEEDQLTSNIWSIWHLIPKATHPSHIKQPVSACDFWDHLHCGILRWHDAFALNTPLSDNNDSETSKFIPSGTQSWLPPAAS
ncbi:MAG: hypothetical protein ABJL67_21890 [Sulfitobacter sp.]